MGSNEKLREITRAHVEDTFAFTDEVVENYPGRLAGKKSCHMAAERIKTELHKHCDSGSVKIEEFNIHPQSFVKYIPGLVIMYFVCVVLLFFGYPIPAFIGFALALFAFYGQFVRYWRLLDPLFPKAKGYNVHGSIEPAGEVKQQIVISAHHDAAYVSQLLTKVPKYYALLVNGGMLFLILGFLVSLVATVLLIFHIILPLWIPIVLIVGGIVVIPMAFSTTGQGVPGAGDNMISVAIAAEIAGIFGGPKKAGHNPLQHTRLIMASFDAEEAGLRGARAYINKHREKLLKTKTYVLNMDTIYKVKYLTFLDKDLNASVKLSHQMAQDCVDIAKSLGYAAGISVMSFGGGSTDAAAFGQAGIEATNIAGMSFDIKDYGEGWVYHTPNDVSEQIEPGAVEAVLKIVREYILRKDASAAQI